MPFRAIYIAHELRVLKTMQAASRLIIQYLFGYLGRPCFTIYKPINGMKNCSGYVTEESCHFDCLPGYELTGSNTRTCGPDKQWTGNSTECKSM